MDIPKDKTYQPGSVQCNDCGGLGCKTCDDRGWLLAGHLKGRRCELSSCRMPLRPNHVAVYCSNECANADAD